MAHTSSAKASLSHEERTADEPRDEGLHSVILDRVTAVNSQIRTYRLLTKDSGGIKFMPGQWLDVYVPDIEKAGGFTITSPPRYAVPPPAQPDRKPYLELAVQKSPDNPPAAWLWQPVEDIIGRELMVRVGGSFVWPPPGVDIESITRAVFIAGGVGINPLMPMLSHVCEECPSLEVRLLYSTKLPSENPDRSEVLFLPQILDLFQKRRVSTRKTAIDLFFTGTSDSSQLSHESPFVRSFLPQPKEEGDINVPITVWPKRIEGSSLYNAVGSHMERRASVFYVCGPPNMTDAIVQHLRDQDGIASERVLCEKWW